MDPISAWAYRKRSVLLLVDPRVLYARAKFSRGEAYIARVGALRVSYDS